MNKHMPHAYALAACICTWPHACAHGHAYARRRYVFGGQYYDVGADLHFECDNTVCMLNLETKAWSSAEADVANPLRRACHAAEVVGRC